MGWRHRTFGPVEGKAERISFSFQTPLRSGPIHCGQSSAKTDAPNIDVVRKAIHCAASTNDRTERFTISTPCASFAVPALLYLSLRDEELGCREAPPRHRVVKMGHRDDKSRVPSNTPQTSHRPLGRSFGWGWRRKVLAY